MGILPLDSTVKLTDAGVEDGFCKCAEILYSSYTLNCH